jgi:parallel beta-helix repeat protein
MAAIARIAGPHVTRRAFAVLTGLLACGALGVAGAPAQAATTCSLYASANGSDGASGSSSAPFATVQHLADTLSAGQTGCVHAGTYTEDVTVRHGGSAGAPLTITSFPGERATLVGRLWIHQGSDYVTVSAMSLDGRNSSTLPSPDINSAHATFSANDVTNEHTAICFDVGSDTTYGRASDTLIQGNRIHDCGPVPSNNMSHGIYVESSDRAQILDNVIYNNADRGVQLYPDAQGTVVERNVIDGNGEGVMFSGDFGKASSNTVVANNTITNATLRADVESWYPSGNPAGTNNSVQGNCVYGGAGGTVDTSSGGFGLASNVTADPGYANRSAGDFRVASSSPCASVIASSAAPMQPFSQSSSGATYPSTSPPSSSGTTGTPSSGPTTTTTSTPTSSRKHRRARIAQVTAARKHARRHHKRHHHHKVARKAVAHKRAH